MKKIFLTTFLFLFSGIMAASAQGFYYGPKAGFNVSTFTKTSFSKAQVKGHLGVFGGYQLDDIVALQAELLYSWQGTKFNDNSSKSISMNYLKIPVLAKFFIAGGFNAEVGLSFDFRTAAQLKDDGRSHSIKGATKNFDLSIPIGLNYQFLERFDVGVRYYLSTIRVWNDPMNKAKNSNWMLSLGFRL